MIPARRGTPAATLGDDDTTNAGAPGAVAGDSVFVAQSRATTEPGGAAAVGAAQGNHSA